jgi:hypothetical protein
MINLLAKFLIGINKSSGTNGSSLELINIMGIFTLFI